MPTGRARLLLIGGAVAAVIVVALVAIALTGGDEQQAAPSPTPEPELHYLVHLDRAVATFGTKTVEASGVVRFSNGPDGIEAVSLAIEPVDTSAGSTGPMSIALSDDNARVTVSGSNFESTFEVELIYPLLYQAVGETITGDVVHPQRPHTASATLTAVADSDQWTGTLKITPGAIEGSDLAVPAGSIELTAPIVYETESQFTTSGGGILVSCIDVQRDAGAFSETDVADALKDMRAIWRQYGRAFMTRQEIDGLNSAILAVEPGNSETRDPGRLPTAKCYTVRLVRSHERGGGASIDVPGRLITVGANALRTCSDTTLGRLLAHMVGHASLRLDADATGGSADNLMRECAPGTSLDADQLATQWSFVAEVARDVTLPEGGAKQNAVFTELEDALDAIVGVGASPSVSPDTSPSPTVTPRRTSTARPTATASPTRSPSPTPTRSPSPTPTRSPSPTPTGSPGGSPTASPTATPTGSPGGSPTPTPTATATASPTPAP